MISGSTLETFGCWYWTGWAAISKISCLQEGKERVLLMVMLCSTLPSLVQGADTGCSSRPVPVKCLSGRPGNERGFWRPARARSRARAHAPSRAGLPPLTCAWQQLALGAETGCARAWRVRLAENARICFHSAVCIDAAVAIRLPNCFNQISFKNSVVLFDKKKSGHGTVLLGVARNSGHPDTDTPNYFKRTVRCEISAVGCKPEILNGLV